MREEKLDEIVLIPAWITFKTRAGSWNHGNVSYTNSKTIIAKVTIALVGKYVELHDAYKSIVESFIHAGAANDCKVNIKWVHSAHDINRGKRSSDIFKDVDGILVAPGFGQQRN